MLLPFIYLTLSLRVERVSELESTVKDLELQLQQQGEETNEVISKWEESYAVLEGKHSELSAALESKESASDALFSLQTQLHETQSALDDAKAKLSEGNSAHVESEGKAKAACLASDLVMFTRL